MRGGRGGALLAALALASACAGRGGAGPGGEPRYPKPELTLSASAASGYLPLDVVLIGRLSGVDPSDRGFDAAGEKWVDRFLDLESFTERKPGKGKLQAQQEGARLFYERTVTITDDGYHSFRLCVIASDGREVYSNWVKVRGISRD